MLYIISKKVQHNLAVPTLSLASFYRRTGTLRPRHEGRETRAGHRGNKVKRKAPKVGLLQMQQQLHLSLPFLCKGNYFLQGFLLLFLLQLFELLNIVI